VAELLRRIREEDPVLPRRRDASIPGDLQNICLKALEKDPAQRYPSAREMADDLRHHGKAFLRQCLHFGFGVGPEPLIIAVGTGAAAHPRYSVVDRFEHRLLGYINGLVLSSRLRPRVPCAKKQLRGV
jgi:hypothetical protein